MKSMRFENLDCWRKSVNLTSEIYQITREGEFEKDFGLRDQIRRAAVSIASNIAEGKERETVAEFIRFLYIAKGSPGELRTQLLIAYRIGYLKEDEYDKLKEEAEHISRMIGGIIRKMRRGKRDMREMQERT